MMRCLLVEAAQTASRLDPELRRDYQRLKFRRHAVPGNSTSLLRFRREVSKRWLRVLQRRSQKSRISWKHLTIFAEQWLPRPKILHPYPYMRFDAKYLR